MKKNIPDIAIIGAAKSGTTTLADLLASHPKICLGLKKEPDFFSNNEHYKRGIEYYWKNFINVEKGQLYLDASTSYSRLPQCSHVAEKLKLSSPDVKIIYIMRHPVERAYSHFIHRYTKELFPNQNVNISFSEHVKNDPMCIDSSNYKLQIEEYLKFFPKGNMFFLFTDELSSHKQDVLKRLCDFLSIDYSIDYFKEDKIKNDTAEYLESRVRIKVTDRMKKNLFYPFLRNIAPCFIKEVIYRMVRNSKLGNELSNDFFADKLTDSERCFLLEGYKDSNKWVEKLVEKELPSWYK